ncbi:intramembrane zinc metalloprotease, RseP [Catenovulum agarivorans DS-2]|uniref:Zinc metalloprotease n=1 Tax=Catenovulum agarivorans DS-2 TaxID=1328313 RepID=W7QQP1_9ALTE|nr:sigma E protease regulator RseP [Catenovulum agarivorans]EWH11312.1 intramembrane zinc metalloprotease, RseP [Catenovulum agarivorans DS-2]
MDFIWNLISFIVAIGVLVTIHEYGHYKVAILSGVYVKRFSIGFGKPLYTWYNQAGTEFVIAAIPLGGYVRMLDSRLDDVNQENQHLAFDNKPVEKRIAIVSAGPLANLFFAVFALWIMYLVGVPEVKPVIGEVIEDTPIATSGVKDNQEIIAINGHKTATWQQVNIELMDAIGDKQLSMSVQSIEQSYARTFTIDLSSWQFDPEKGNLIQSLGIRPFTPKILPTIAHVADDTPASRAGLKVGDQIIAYNQVEPFDWRKLSSLIKQSPNQPLQLVVERDGQIEELSLTIGVRESNGEQAGYLGIAPQLAAWPEHLRFEHSFGVVESFQQAVVKTWRLITVSFSMIEKLLTGDVSYKSLSGPISIAQGAGQSAGLGIVYFLSFLALISVNLGIINLLPLPVLDGGHLVYYLIEFVSGKPVPEKVQEIGFRVGAFIIFMLMSVAILNDLSRW